MPNILLAGFAALFLVAPAAHAQTPAATSLPATARTVQAHAASVVQDTKVSGVRCQAGYSWPKQLRSGFFPLGIRLSNRNSESIEVDVSAETSWGSEDLVRRRVMLEPGEVAEFELLLRARRMGMNAYRVTFEAGGEETWLGACGPSASGWGGDGQNMMVVSAQPYPDGTQERLTGEWEKGDSSTMWAPKTGTPTVSARTFGQLSTNWQAYTSLDAVVLDLAEGAPSMPVMGALAAWCRTGGTLVVLGATMDSLRGLPALAPALEERFRVNPAYHPEHAGGDGPTATDAFEKFDLAAYRFGFGTLITRGAESSDPNVIETDNDGLSPAYVACRADVAKAWSRTSRSSVPLQATIQRDIERFNALPLRSLMAMMLLFVLILGPANFMWVRHKKKPMLLLVTVPVISTLTSVGLLLYGVFGQGLDIRAKSVSWALLDQTTQQATSIEVRRVFAGSSPGEGLRPQVGTCVFPEPNKWKGSYQAENLFVADYTEGRVLSGDYFPVRRPFAQMVVSERASRLRLGTEWLDDGVRVSNALGAGIERMLLRNPDGQYFALEAGLPEGGAVELTPTSGTALLVLWGKDLGRYWGEGGEGLIPGSYLAKMANAPLRDDCGVEVIELDGRHMLLGILDVEEGGSQ